jgi:hypothetical protein
LINKLKNLTGNQTFLAPVAGRNQQPDTDFKSSSKLAENQN